LLIDRVLRYGEQPRVFVSKASRLLVLTHESGSRCRARLEAIACGDILRRMTGGRQQGSVFENSVQPARGGKQVAAPAIEQIEVGVDFTCSRSTRCGKEIENRAAISLYALDSYRSMEMASKNTICLWYDGTAMEAAQFYAATFPDSQVGAVMRAPGEYPSGKEGDVLTVEFTVLGIPCVGLNGGPAFKHNESFSFQVATDDQAETDRLWNAIVGNGGRESECGWCKDRWGVSWQITPRALLAAVTDPDRAAAKRAFDAMLTMKKIDIATIEAARRG
jgi:2-polyprenyl-6-hydroxyphenyl methylase/3-demethylubiquinone-9 3-methyltransferase